MPIEELHSPLFSALFLFTLFFIAIGIFLNRSPANTRLFPYLSAAVYILLFCLSASSPSILSLVAITIALLHFSARISPISGLLTFAVILLLDVTERLDSGSSLAPVGFSFLLMRAHDSFAQSRDAGGQRIPLTLASFQSDLLRIFSLPALPFGPVILKDRFEIVKDSIRTFSLFYTGAILYLILGISKIYLLIPFLKLNFETGPLPFRFSFESITNLLHSGLYKYTLLYLDFSACSDIAVGFSGILGMKIAHNFRHPYMALTLRDFWGRWNITVVEWIGRYVFRTKGEPMAEHGILTGALLIFMAGLWHGMTVQFALWALLHGGAFALESRAFRRIDRSPQSGFAIPALRFLMTQGFVIVTANLLG